MYSSSAKAVYLLRERKYICFGQYTISSLKNERDSRILPLHTAIMGEFRAEDFPPLHVSARNLQLHFKRMKMILLQCRGIETRIL